MTNRQEEAGSRWVVYALDDDGKPTHFLGVCDDAEEATETMDKWWKAFRTGEKAEPRDYGGVSKRPVATFEEWGDG